MEKIRCRPKAIVHFRRLQKQRGVFAIMTALLLIVLFGFCGLALDLARIYNRKVEMENVATTTALAAASSLNGTVDGVRAAVAAASNRLTDQSPRSLTYQYSKRQMDWSDAALKFSSSPNGEWVSVDTALANPAGLLFAKVDTRNLDASYGRVDSMFMQILSPAFAVSTTGASATAGRSAINVLPMALCAMRPEEALNRSGELVEFGFRRGVSYDLMQLNKDANAAAGQTFLLNPMSSAGTTPLPADLASVKPFICTGSMAFSSVSGKNMKLEGPFPLSSLYGQLNSRFDTFVTPCNEYTAPPDLNVKSYVATAAGVPWMSVVPRQSALLSTDGDQSGSSTAIGPQRWTVADPDPSPGGTQTKDNGPLWSYAKAVKFAPTEPANGYTTFENSHLKNLYAGNPKFSSYPDGTPYAPSSSSSTVLLPPSGKKGLTGRRVLNIPLLSCPVAGNKALVLGIGRFFMTVPATSTSLVAEFAGLISDQKLGRPVELYK